MKKEKSNEKNVTKKQPKPMQNVKVNEKELKENLKNIENMVNKKELPKEEKNKINKRVFENVLIADLIMAFLFLLTLGSLNIETTAFITDLKVFSIGLIILTIILFEYSYKNDNANVCIHGIECLVLAIFTLFSISLYSIYFRDFHLIVSSISYLFAIYYVAKSIIIQVKMKKKYIESINDINEIIKK